MIQAPLQAYLSKIEADIKHGQATELTHRSSLEWLLEALHPGIRASSDPKHIDCGAPDFIVERGHVPLGYVETKNVGADLDKAEKSDQLKRYRQSLNNLILTDYLEFRWYVSGEVRLKLRLASVGKDGKLQSNTEGLILATQLFEAFYQIEVPIIGRSSDLAKRLANSAKLVRDLIVKALQSKDDEVNSPLHHQYKTFQKYLLPDLKATEFADIYAQTMAYGLFAARLNAPQNVEFTRSSAYRYLAVNRFLRKLFLDVGEELDETVIAPFLDDIASLLTRADMASILKDFGKRTRTEDPVVHFYETFLAEYDPKLRKSRGVFYTPEPVVQFIVASVDWLLKTLFGRPWGLADKDVYLLDPATGTGTFLYFVIRIIHDTLTARGQQGTWQEYIREKLLPRIFGFELLVAPYVIAHLKLGLELKELGYEMGKDDHIRVFLTNTLDEGVTQAEKLEDIGWYISQEASEASQVKKHTPIVVVLGNPPYSNFGMLNKNDWILGLLKTYKSGLGERKINLDDDYIKFIRFGQWRIEKTGQGVLAFITNNSFIDGITHRRMRQSLMETFTEIYVLDLHGSTKKQEKAPDGSKDGNVFDIQQGVCITLFVKEPNKAGPARVHHSEMWGTRESKYAVLSESDISSIHWTELQPKAEGFFFVPRTEANIEEYMQGWAVPDVFVRSNSAIQTKKDALTIHFTRQSLKLVLEDIKEKDAETLRNIYDLGIDGRDWTVQSAKDDVMKTKGQICPVQYRPFDVRWTYFTGNSKGFIAYPRADVTSQLLHPNLALATVRQITGVPDLCEVFVTEHTMTDRCMRSTLGTPYLFPLYIYTTPDETEETLFAQYETTRKSNLSPDFIKAASQKLGLTFIQDGVGDMKATFGPEDILHFAYAILHSPVYRERYAEFLKIDFPRLPLTTDRSLFAELANKGAELIGLHLLRSVVLEDFISSYPEVGNNIVEQIAYKDERVWINDKQYFGRIPKNVWSFRVGGYQVCEKWLKDRKGRKLTSDDISHYQKVVVALKETIRLMSEIDEIIPSWPIE